MICGAHLLPPPTLFVVARHHAITIERYRTSVFLLKKGSQYLCNSIFHLLTDDRVWTRVREPAGAERKGAPNSQLPDQPFCRQVVAKIANARTALLKPFGELAGATRAAASP